MLPARRSTVNTRPPDQLQNPRGIGLPQPISDADRTIGIEKRPAVECLHRARKIQLRGQTRHAAWRPRADQRGWHPGRPQAKDRLSVGSRQGLVVPHQRPVDIRYEQADRLDTLGGIHVEIA